MCLSKSDFLFSISLFLTQKLRDNAQNYHEIYTVFSLVYVYDDQGC
jgi:hypothetical protein